MLNARRLGCAGWPGCAPAGASLFFASPKQSKQKKGEPDSSAREAGTLRCSRRAGCAETRLSPQTSAPLIRPALRYSPPHDGVRTAETARHPSQQGRAMARPCRVLYLVLNLSWSWSSVPAVLARLSSAGASGSRSARCLSPQGEFARFPLAPSSARHPAGAVSAARLFFGDFLLAKQKKVTAPSGAYPDSLPPQRDPACADGSRNGQPPWIPGQAGNDRHKPAMPAAEPAC